MSSLSQLQGQWRDFATDRTRERLQINQELDRINEQQAELNARKTKIQVDFNEKWKQEKEKRREALDEEVMAELATGRSAQDILRELGSSNTVWIYKLRQKVIDQYGNVIHRTDKSSGPPEPQPDVNIEGIMWEHSDHEGVHGLLVDTSRNYLKKYGNKGTEFEDEWFVADMTNTYVAGNKQLYESTSMTDLTKRVSMLTQLLDGNYKGRIKISPNKYRN